MLFSKSPEELELERTLRISEIRKAHHDAQCRPIAQMLIVGWASANQSITVEDIASQAEHARNIAEAIHEAIHILYQPDEEPPSE